MLWLRRAEQQHRVAEERERLARVERRLKQPEREGDVPDHGVIVRSVGQQLAAAIWHAEGYKEQDVDTGAVAGLRNRVPETGVESSEEAIQ